MKRLSEKIKLNRVVEKSFCKSKRLFSLLFSEDFCGGMVCSWLGWFAGRIGVEN